MSCLAAYTLIFQDPFCGPVTFDLSVWRDTRDLSTDYVVVVD